MPRPPAVSVIVCFLNEAPFLADAVRSIVGQTFGDWELWLVDDGSTDGSSAIARQLAAADPDPLIRRCVSKESVETDCEVSPVRSRQSSFVHAWRRCAVIGVP